jgi:hypothetical protein
LLDLCTSLIVAMSVTWLDLCMSLTVAIFCKLKYIVCFAGIDDEKKTKRSKNFYCPMISWYVKLFSCELLFLLTMGCYSNIGR